MTQRGWRGAAPHRVPERLAALYLPAGTVLTLFALIDPDEGRLQLGQK